MIDALVMIGALTLARVGTFIYFVPLLGGPNIPRTVKVGLTFALTALFYDDAAANVAQMGAERLGSVSWVLFLVTMGREFLLGGIMGFALNLFLIPARIAGEFVAQESGLTFASVLTASGDGSANPFSTLFEMVASVAFFTLDMHHLFLQLLRETFRAYPIGSAFGLPGWNLVAAASAAQEQGLVLAAPMALCLVLTTIILILLSRAAPQLNLFSVGFPLRVIVSLAAVLLLLPHLLNGVVNQSGWLIDLLGLRR